MMRPAVTSGIAPCRVAATWMLTSRSFFATVRSRPSPTSLRPSFQLAATRCANEAMSSGRAVGTIRITIWAPFALLDRLELALRASACAAVSVAVWSMTRAVSTGTGTTSSAKRAGAAPARPRRSERQRSRIASVGRRPASAAQRDAGFSKLTAGGTEICASLATVKFGLSL